MPRLLGQLLTGPQSRDFRSALRKAFSLQSFTEMLWFQLSKPLDTITTANGLDAKIFDVIRKADEESWTAELLQAARLERPHDIDLFTFAQQFGLAIATPQGEALERKIEEANSDLDILPWRKRLSEIEAQVCRIEISGSWPPTYGTGFLLGPNLVMTNYHVVEDVILGKVPPERVICLFDYKVMDDGITINAGTPYTLASKKWCVDYSEYSQLDSQYDTEDAVPQEDQLDYALFRLSRSAGTEPVGGENNKMPNAPARGWISIPATSYDFRPESALFIVHHPDKAPLKVSLNTNSILFVNKNATRVRYKTNTESGSSGSPCFHANWGLVALHHASDPIYKKFYQPQYNQGIPFAAILHLMAQRGTITVFTQ
jgi:hypothetical protein